MNRKELGCAAVGALLGAAGCSSAARALLVPEASAAAQPDFVPSGVVISYLWLYFPYPQPRASHVFLIASAGYTVSSSNTAVLQASVHQGVNGTQARVDMTSRGKGEAIVKVHYNGSFVLQVNAFVHALA